MPDIGVPVSQISGIALEAGVIEPDFKYLYAGLGTVPAKLIKMDAENFQIVASYTFASGENDLAENGTIIYGNYAYVSLYTPKGRIAKIDLTTMTRVGTINLSSIDITNDNFATNAVLIDNLGLWIVPRVTASGLNKVYKVNLNTDTELAYGSFGSAISPLQTIVKNFTGDTIFCSVNGSPAQLYSMNVATMSPDLVNYINFATFENGAPVAVLNKTFDTGYYGTGNVHNIAKIGMTGYLREIKSILCDTFFSITGILEKNSYRFIYFGLDSGTSKRIAVLDIGMDTVIQYLDFGINSAPYGMATNKNNTWFGFATTPGKIVKIRNTNFEQTDFCTLPTGNNTIKMLFGTA